MITPCSGKRGCGTREEGGLYACVSTSILGRPIEEFIIDPAREWKGKCFRAPILYEGRDAFHMLVWVGAEFYPFIPDFIEEARIMGVSRRIPRGFPIEKLTPGKSKMFLIHSRAVPKFEYQVLPSGMCLKKDTQHLCTFDTWSLSSLDSSDKHLTYSELHDSAVEIKTPSVAYKVNKCLEVPKERLYQPGAFAAFYLTHLEYIDKEGKAPRDLAEKIEKAEFDLLVLPD